jgi:hypothetical protein
MPTASPPASAPRRLSRDEVLRLGQTSRPWDFLPVGLAALRAAPTDAAVRFLLAATFAKLGLRTAAAEHLGVFAELGGAAVMPRQHAALSGAIAALAEDRIPGGVALDTCRFNLEMLASRGIDLWPEHERWRLGQAGCEWFRTSDGNIARRRGEVWLGLAEQRLAASRFAGDHIDPRQPQPVYYLEGLDPPWVALEVARATPPTITGFQPLICVVQQDAQEFLDGLAQADLAALLRDERARFFVGPGAAQEMGVFLRRRLDYGLAGPHIPLRSTRRVADPSVDAVLTSARADQQRVAESLAGEVAARAADRDAAWWLRRYAHALMPGSCMPLRVLIPTTRHSTYLQHSSRDLAEAFAAAGHQARLLVEEDGHSQMCPVAYLRALRDFDPDLVVVINCMRGHLGDWFPPVPYICWIQDSLRHQFDARLAARQGSLDFLVGHLHGELFAHFGFPRDRTLSMPVVSSERKFHPEPVAVPLRERFECEVAFVSHHSETPEQMHLRLLAEAGADRPVIRTLKRLFPEVDGIARDPLGGDQQPRLERAVRGALRHEGADADPRTVTQFLHQYALPLTERILRHQTLDWAAEIAARRGWRFRIFGRGWAKHPSLGCFAAGPVEHGEDLRACYQCAGVQLHISATALVHQRIMECALSGGLPLCRLTRNALDTVYNAVRREAWLRSAPARHDAATGLHGFVVADSPELLAYTSLLQRLGLPAEGVLWQAAVNLERVRANPLPPEHRPDWVLADMAQTTFATPEALEASIERALSAPGWRRGMSETIAGRVRSRLTHSAFVGRVLGLVRGQLTRTVSPPGGGGPLQR